MTYLKIAKLMGCLLLLAATSVPAVAIADDINVEVFEWGLNLDKSTVKSGTLNLTVKNLGDETHELVIIKLKDGYGAEDLPVNQHGAIDEDNMNFGTIIGEVEDITEHKKISKTFNLEPGNYAVLCNLTEEEEDKIETHYSMGMRAGLKVE